jgi:DNA-binding NarL/FixJ family response regulator
MDSSEPGSVSLEVLVSDANENMVRLLAADLRQQRQFDVSECLANPAQIVEAISKRKPSVLLLGLLGREPVTETVSILRRIQAEFWPVRAIILSEETGRDLVIEVFRAGAKGFVDRSSYDPVLVCRSIRCVASGQIWANSEQLSLVLDVFADAPVWQDSERLASLAAPEREVARLAGDGLSNSEIARRLGLSNHRLKNYLFSVFEKIGVSSHDELVLYLRSQNRQSRTSIYPRTPEHPSQDLNQ